MPTEPEVEVRFNQHTIYETDGPKKGPVFEKGSVHRFPESFAQRWIRRGVAELIVKAKDIVERSFVRKEETPEPSEPAPAPAPEPVKPGPRPTSATTLSAADLGRPGQPKSK